MKDQQQTKAQLIEEVNQLRRLVAAAAEAEEALREKEALFRGLFENHRAVKMIIDAATGKIKDANGAAADFYGWSREQLRQMRVQEINTLPPEMIRQKMAEANAGRGTHFEFRHRRADGSIRDVEVFSSRIATKNEVLLHSIIHDITERKRAEGEGRINLALQRLRNQVLQLEGPQDWEQVTAVFFAELHTLVPCYRSSIQLVDPAKGTYSGYYTDGGSVVPYRFLEVPDSLRQVVASGRPHYRRTWAEIVAGGESVSPRVGCIVDVPFLGGTAAMSSLEENAFGDQEIALLERFAQVLSEGYRKLKEANRVAQLERQLVQAQKLEAVGQLSAGIAHNFNNLLQAVVANLSLAAMKGPPQIQGYIEEADAAAMRGADLVRQLMLFSRAEVGGEVSSGAVDLAMAVGNVTSLARKTIDRQIQLPVEIAPNLPLVQADAGQLEQVLINLILNARDALEGVTRPEPWIRIRVGLVQRQGPDEAGVRDYLQVVVRDNGTGMDAQTQARIFEPFFTTKEVGKGTGLGLATVYGILQRHGGWIECESEVGAGTSFILYLLAVVAPVVVPEKEQSPDLPGGTETVLLVDDEELVRRGIGELLAALGYQVLEAEDGQQGLELASRHRGQLGLVLLDLSMPGLSGLEVLRRLRAADPRLKVMIFTGFSPERTQFEGAVAVIEKPFSLRKLAGVVRKVLDGPPGEGAAIREA